jgi:hypothetical protein
MRYIIYFKDLSQFIKDKANHILCNLQILREVKKILEEYLWILEFILVIS